MERKKCLLIIFLSFTILSSSGQSNKTIYKAYISGNMVEWKNAMGSLETKPGKTNKDKLDLINYQYGYIAWCIDQDKTHEAEKYMKTSEKLIEELEQKKYNLSMLYAYKAAFVGFKIGISPYKAPFIGAESLKYAKQSVSIDSTNALGHVQLGNIKYYTPTVFGGSKKDAMQHYVRALKLMENQPDITDDNWNYLNILATIINAYLELGQYKLAKYYSVKTLSVEPNFEWVKNKLYPQVLQQLKDG